MDYYGYEPDMLTFYHLPFYRLPKTLFLSDKYKSLSNEAKLLYCLMLDKTSLSIQNHRQDADGHTFIFFRQELAMKLLGIGKDKAIKLYRELEEMELIKRKRQGLTFPDIIYVARLPDESKANDADSDAEIDSAEDDYELQSSLNSEKPSSDFRKIRVQIFGKSDFIPNNENKNNETLLNETDRSADEGAKPPKRAKKPPEYVIEGVTALESQIRMQIDYETLIANRPWDQQNVNGIVTLIADTCASRKPSIRIGGELHKSEEVKRRLLSLEQEDIEAVLESVYNPENQTTRAKIRNMKAYLLTTLYNAPGTSAAFNENINAYGD